MPDPQPKSPDAQPKNMDSVLGKLVVDQGLATSDEVYNCVKVQRQRADAEDPNERSLAHILVTKGIVTQRQIDRLKPEAEKQKTQQQIPGYRIVKRIGSGAMASVYLARQLSLDREVAVKILPLKHTNNPEFVERFYAEGRAAAKLNHPNIVHALDVGQAGDTHYFAMELVDGRTVYADIVEHKRYSEQDALKIIIQIARALEHAHKAGLIHRDVKPKNIMIAERGNAKLADMGLARAVSDREAAEAEAGRAFGTPYYISPEQIRGALDVDFRADIYSLGATFYHMVTGQVPFEGANPSAVMQKHLKDELVPPDHINPAISVGLAEIIEVCLAKDRRQRYESTSALLADLESVSRGGAPLLARQKFDVSSLTALGTPAQDDADPTGPPQPNAWRKPQNNNTLKIIAWLGLAGWILVIIMLIVVLMPR